MIQKAFILGAGLGTRLRPLTDRLPKPLIPVFHRPLVTHGLDRCLAADIRSFAINTHHLPQAWAPVFSDERGGTSYRGAPIHLVHEPDLLETGGGLKNVADWIGDEPILIYNGDILTDIDVSALIEAHLASGNTATLALRSHGFAPHIALDPATGLIPDIRNLLGRAEGTHQFTGVYCVDPAILDLIPANEKVSVIPAFLELAKAGRLGGIVLDDGLWADLGTPEAYFEIHRRDDLGPRIHPSAKIDPTAAVDKGSVIGPDCFVGPGATVENSILWPGARVEAGAVVVGEVITG